MEELKPFVNARIEGPFAETYKGYNQYLFTGGIDDLFLVDASPDGTSPRLCKIDEAFAEFGRKAGYDIVVTLRDDLTLRFATPDQERRFQSIVRGTSDSLVEHGHTARQFVPRPRPAAVSAPDGVSGGALQPSAAAAARAAAADVSSRTRGSGELNVLEQITRILKDRNTRTLVIFPYPERMWPTGSADGAAIQRMEVLVKGWRDIVRDAHPDTRTVLIVNPHRLAEFHLVEHSISCYDHNCREVTVGQPSVEEMKAWLWKYWTVNNIHGTKREADRVILTGKANTDGNLQNFVSWVQSFFLRNPGRRQWSALLSQENQEAAESKEDLLEELDELIGLCAVKREIHAIVADAERNGATAADAAYHMFFLGNPGTGKTVVANIVARLFWSMELRTNKKVVTVTIQDIVSQYNEGDTIQRMKDKVAEAMGGVLFIDEAYLFAESEWGRKAFQVLLTEMENNRKNLTVILAGYEERLQALKDVNPGIDSRIPYKLHFSDYSKEEKLEIFKLHLAKEDRAAQRHHELTVGAEEKLLRVLDGCEGNGRGVRNVLERTLKNAGTSDKITDEHVTDPHEVHPDEAESVLKEIDENFIGMDGLKLRLRKFFNGVRYRIERDRTLGLTRRTGSAYRIRFTGPPGTGKTSIARYMGRFFHAMGICETSECRECGATSLKGAYIGHAQQTVNNLFHENRGKVIFIDEIYSLYNPDAHQDDSFSREVIDTLVRCLTAEEYQGTVVIVAGYKDRVDRFMDANPGLASRIPDEIEFEDYSADDCVAIFESVAKRQSYVVLPSCRDRLRNYFAFLKAGRNFGNARDVNGVFGLVESHIVDRLAEKVERVEEDFRNITPDDIPEVPGEDTEDGSNERKSANEHGE